MTDRQTDHYNGLDLVKFFMAICIVILHSFAAKDGHPLLDFEISQCFTRFAVPFFFITSGFLLFRKMPLAQGKLDVERIIHYLCHIFRLYFSWLILYMPIFIILIVHDNKDVAHAALRLFRDLTIGGSFWQLWYLKGLIVAVIIITLLLWRGIGFKKIFIITGLLYCIACLGTSYYGLFSYCFPEGSRGWEMIHLLAKVYVTPRDGICFGALFVAIGAYCAKQSDQNITAGLILKFMVSMMLLIGEANYTRYFHLFVSGDCYFSLIPAGYYAFNIARNLQLRDKPVYTYLRKQSMYIFGIHGWWLFFISRIFGNGKYSIYFLPDVCHFLIILFLSIVCSHVLIKMNNQYKTVLRYLD